MPADIPKVQQAPALRRPGRLTTRTIIYTDASVCRPSCPPLPSSFVLSHKEEDEKGATDLVFCTSHIVPRLLHVRRLRPMLRLLLLHRWRSRALLRLLFRLHPSSMTWTMSMIGKPHDAVRYLRQQHRTLIQQNRTLIARVRALETMVRDLMANQAPNR